MVSTRSERKRSKSPKSSRKSSSKKSEKHDRKRKRSRTPEHVEEVDRPSRKDTKVVEANEQHEASSAAGAGDSLSIEETNKLRASLGLAPLEVDKSKSRKEYVDEADGGGDEKPQFMEESDKLCQDANTGRDFVHRMPENWGDKKHEEKMREKLAAAKEKRQITEKMLKVKSLGEEEEDDTAASWVNKQRQIEDEKRKAEQRAKMLQEMDDEFGVSDIVKKEMKPKKSTGSGSRSKPRSSKGQQSMTGGLTVKHAKDSFLEGSETILVLEDKGVLDEDAEEALVNPTLMEQDQWKRNVELRKKKPGYTPYDEDEFDEFGMPKPKKAILDKYDEELDARKIESFKLDESGQVDVSEEKRLADIKAKLKAANTHTLVADKFQIANEYYTTEEYASFKKSKKKVRKVRKRAALKADDLVMESGETEDFGSRSRGKGRKKPDYEDTKTEEGEIGDHEQTDQPKHKHDIKAALKTAMKREVVESESEDEDNFGGLDSDGETQTKMIVHDDAQDELQSMLDKARRFKQVSERIKQEGGNGNEKHTTAAQRIGNLVASTSSAVDNRTLKVEPMDHEDTNVNGVTLDSTSEYCRGLGESLKDELTQRADALDIRNIDFDTDQIEAINAASATGTRRGSSKRSGAHTSSTSRGLTAGSSKHKKNKWVEEGMDVDDEHDWSDIKREHNDGSGSETSSSDNEDGGAADLLGAGLDKKHTLGVAGALKLAHEKGFIEEGEATLSGETVDRMAGTGKVDDLMSKRYSIMDKTHGDIDDKYAKKLDMMDRRGGPTRPFEEKDSYKPKFHLTYVDDQGKHLGQREAWRQMCWKFHGRFPGKKQVEKRHRKQQEQRLVDKMQQSDTPLGTLNKQLDKQKSLALPYIVLSGQGSSDVGTSIKKD